jgi:hypothetical protein
MEWAKRARVIVTRELEHLDDLRMVPDDAMDFVIETLGRLPIPLPSDLPLRGVWRPGWYPHRGLFPDVNLEQAFVALAKDPLIQPPPVAADIYDEATDVSTVEDIGDMSRWPVIAEEWVAFFRTMFGDEWQPSMATLAMLENHRAPLSAVVLAAMASRVSPMHRGAWYRHLATMSTIQVAFFMDVLCKVPGFEDDAPMLAIATLPTESRSLMQQWLHYRAWTVDEMAVLAREAAVQGAWYALPLFPSDIVVGISIDDWRVQMPSFLSDALVAELQQFPLAAAVATHLTELTSTHQWSRLRRKRVRPSLAQTFVDVYRSHDVVLRDQYARWMVVEMAQRPSLLGEILAALPQDELNLEHALDSQNHLVYYFRQFAETDEQRAALDVE